MLLLFCQSAPSISVLRGENHLSAFHALSFVISHLSRQPCAFVSSTAVTLGRISSWWNFSILLTKWKTIPLECFGEARLSRNLGLSLFTASRVTLSKGQREIGFRMILFIVFSVTNLCGMAPKLAELIRGWAFDGCFPVEDATSALFDGFFFSTFTLFRL